MIFVELKFESKGRGKGKRAKVWFDNGYGASIINDGYGGDEGLYELAILTEDGICYDTEITNDVIGYLTPMEVSALLERIENL